jgi:hypothetical protein
MYVHRSGLVELLWALSVESSSANELVLDAQEIAAVVVPSGPLEHPH